MERWSGKTAVVTGASVGIGAAIAVALADAGMIVVAGARRAELLQELQKSVKGRGRIIPVKCDVSDEEDIVQLIETAKKNGGVDVLVNNAAVLYNGSISDARGTGSSLKDIEQSLKVNVLAVVKATRLAVADMEHRKVPGVIIMVNSISGHKVIAPGSTPDIGVYGATKYAITALAETIRLEFSYTGLPIKITSLSPGAVDTQMVRDVFVNHPTLRDKFPMLKPQDIADAVIYVLSAPDSVNISEMTVQVTGEQF